MIKKSEHGYTLIEISVVILILGLMTGSFFVFYKPIHERRLRDLTIERQNRIALSLANFAQQYGRLPCPGHPDAPIRGNPRINATPSAYPDTNTQPAGVCNGASPAERTGIVPYRILGLSEKDVTDGWNNPISYTVDLFSTDIPNEVAYNAGIQVHNQCRALHVWVSYVDNTINGHPQKYQNFNEPKARFCCRLNTPDISPNRLMIYTSPNGSPDKAAAEVQQNGAWTTGTFDYPDNHALVATPAQLSFFTYALVSHGPNGAGAQIYGSAARLPTAGAGLSELDNANPALTYRRDLPRSTAAGNTYFDDIVLWRTNRSMFAEFGDSCNRP